MYAESGGDAAVALYVGGGSDKSVNIEDVRMVVARCVCGGILLR